MAGTRWAVITGWFGQQEIGLLSNREPEKRCKQKKVFENKNFHKINTMENKRGGAM